MSKIFNILNDKAVYKALVKNVGETYPFHLLEIASEKETIKEQIKTIINSIDDEINSDWTTKKEKKELEKVKKIILEKGGMSENEIYSKSLE